MRRTGTSKSVNDPFSKMNLSLVSKTGPNARIWSATTIEEKLENFSNKLVKALDLACPKKRSNIKYKFPTWWDQNLSKLRSKLRFLAKKKTPEGKQAYVSLRREYKKKTIKNARDEGWKKFTYEIKYPSDVSKLIKNFNNSKNNALGLLKNNRGVNFVTALMSHLIFSLINFSQVILGSWIRIPWNGNKSKTANLTTLLLQKSKGCFSLDGLI